MELINKIKLASPLQFDSIVDGPNLRMVLWTQGCPHHCIGCHNPQTHEVQGGNEYIVEEIITQIMDSKIQNGLTLSGGEPFQQATALIPIVEACKYKGIDIWAYSGYTFEQLQLDSEKKKLLDLIDVLVDGKFEESKKDYQLWYKGSTNQRIIDVQKSIIEKKVIISEYDKHNQDLEQKD